MLTQKKILLAISGGIASYKMANFCRRLIKEGAKVRVVMTPAASRFISPLTFETLTKHKVIIDDFSLDHHDHVHHIEWAQWSDYTMLAPATANSLAKLAHGLADNFVSSLLLASPRPIFIVPAMNDHMYHQGSTQRNISQVQQDGHYVMEPASGFLAEGYEAKGRLPEDQAILDELISWIITQEDRPLKNKNIVVTSGGTKERIDPVRYLSNDSSGRMGNAIAQAAYLQGAKVTLITASDLSVHPAIHRIQVESAADMYEAVDQHFSQADALIMSAAVSDFKLLDSHDQKIKKSAGQDTLTIQLGKNPDIVQAMAAKKDQQIVVGFAAETQHLEAYAWDKLKRKNLDMIVANDVSHPDIGFNVEDNEVLLLRADGQKKALAKQSKTAIAQQVIEEIRQLMEDRYD